MLLLTTVLSFWADVVCIKSVQCSAVASCLAWHQQQSCHRVLCLLRMKMDGPYDSKVLPVVLALCLVASLVVVFSGAVVRLHDEV